MKQPSASRRVFIGGTIAGALLGGTWLPRAVTRAAECSQRLPGVQLYTLRDPLQSDPRGTLAALGRLGIRELELYGVDAVTDGRLFGLPLADLKSAVQQNGLSLPSAHVGGALTDNATSAAAAERLGITKLFVALPTEFSANRDGVFTMVGAESIEQLDRLAERLNRAGRELRDRGITFGYHNHHVEFLPVNGRVPFDYLMANTDPDLVKIELDLGWLAVAGMDLNEYLTRYEGRVLACHLKDFTGDSSVTPIHRSLVEPGAGTVDFGAVLEAMDRTGVAHGFIEVDLSDDPLGAVERGHRYLQMLRGC
jgi:sugar phosphate isomerase/epimerase